MSYETYHIPVNFTDAGKLFGVFEIRNAVETVLLCIPILFLCLALLPLTLMPKIIVTMTILVPCGRLCAHWHRRRQPHQMAQGVDKLAQAPAHDLLPRGGASMSMKDAIFGTAAPIQSRRRDLS